MHSFYINIKILNYDYILNINEEKKQILTFIMCFLSNIKQQQVFVKFFNLKVNYCYYFCNINTIS